MGFGVGSSWALVASVFDRYGINKSTLKEEEQDLGQLKKEFLAKWKPFPWL